MKCFILQISSFAARHARDAPPGVPSGAPGAAVTVSGKFLLGASGVSFNGTPAITFSNISANYLSVTVPPGATTGKRSSSTARPAPSLTEPERELQYPDDNLTSTTAWAAHCRTG